MVDPECRAWCAIRSVGSGPLPLERHRLGGNDPVTAGARENSRRLGRSLKWRSAPYSRSGASRPPPSTRAMDDGPLGRLFWRVVYAVDYWLMRARLRIVDAVCGP